MYERFLKFLEAELAAATTAAVQYQIVTCRSAVQTLQDANARAERTDLERSTEDA